MDDYFFAANSAAKGGDLAQLDRLFTGTCNACTSAFEDFESAQQAGLRASGDRYADWATTLQSVQPSRVLLTTRVDFAEVALIDEQGTSVDQIPAWKNAEFAWTLVRQENGNWLIVQGELL